MITKEKKVSLVNDYSKEAEIAKSILLVDFGGLKMSEMTELRKKLRQIGVKIKILRKTLIQRILANSGHKNFDVFQFPASVAMVFSPEEGPLASKTIFEFSKKNKALNILGGFVFGDYKASESVISLAKLPSREALLGQLVFTLNSIPRALVGVLDGKLKKETVNN